MAIANTTRCRYWLAAPLLAAWAVVLAMPHDSQAGIVCPDPIRFDSRDLERELAGKTSTGGSAAPGGSQHAPASDDDQNRKPSDRLEPGVPSNSSSSSSSSSPTGGPGAANGGLSILNAPLIIADDAQLGRLPEDLGLSLPEPPGTDLLRPPRAA